MQLKQNTNTKKSVKTQKRNTANFHEGECEIFYHQKPDEPKNVLKKISCYNSMISFVAFGKEKLDTNKFN